MTAPCTRRLDLALVILNFRTPQLVLDCLRSLADQIRSDEERVVVVDNDSGDGSLERIRAGVEDEGWSDWVILHEAGGNFGFSAGNNAGILRLDASAYLLLNSDTYLRPGALEEFRAALAQNPEVDLFSPRLEWPDGSPQRSVFRFPGAWSEFERSAGTGFISRMLARRLVAPPETEERVSFEWASFAAILIRRRVFDRIGLMDEGYFLYFEDVDFCKRAAQAGCRTMHWPTARVVHLRGGSGPVKERLARLERPPSYYFAARSRYFGKFHGRFGLWTANTMWLLGRLISWPREMLRNKQRHLCAKEARDLWHHALRPVKVPEGWRGEWEASS